jgi:hypothetical protein
MGWSAMGVYNVLAYGADNSGVSDSRAAINAAITACNAAGGGTVYMPPGTYSITVADHPVEGSGTQTGLVMRSKVILAGAGPEATILKLADNQAASVSSYMIAHYNVTTAGGDSDFSFRDFTLDGNYSNQGGGAKTKDFGIQLWYAVRVWHNNVVVRGVYGTDGGVTGEGMNFHITGSRVVRYTDCEAYGGGGNSTTSTLFACSAGNDVQYTACYAHDSGRGHGFANWDSTHVQYANCISQRNYMYGFNLEYSRYIQYVNCIAGGLSAYREPAIQGTKRITGIDQTTQATITSVAHGFANGGVVHIGGSYSQADTDIKGMLEIADKVYVVSDAAADTFDLKTYVNTPAYVNSSGYTTYISGGIISPVWGNGEHGFRCFAGRDVDYTGCHSIANGTHIGSGFAGSGVNIEQSHRRVHFNGGVYAHNKTYGITN